MTLTASCPAMLSDALCCPYRTLQVKGRGDMDTYVWRPRGPAAPGVPSCSSGSSTAHVLPQSTTAVLPPPPPPPPAAEAGVPQESGSGPVTLTREASLATDATARLQHYLISCKGPLRPDAQTAGG